jgi:hypothetical protein
MTHVPNHRHAAATLATVIAITASVGAAPASARTFDFNSAGSMVQQPLGPQWACAIQRALGDRGFPCRGSSVLTAPTIGSRQLSVSAVGRPRWPAVDISAYRRGDDHRAEPPASNE